jgi:hypothetical protein
VGEVGEVKKVSGALAGSVSVTKALPQPSTPLVMRCVLTFVRSLSLVTTAHTSPYSPRVTLQLLLLRRPLCCYLPLLFLGWMGFFYVFFCVFEFFVVHAVFFFFFQVHL